MFIATNARGVRTGEAYVAFMNRSEVRGVFAGRLRCVHSRGRVAHACCQGRSPAWCCSPDGRHSRWGKDAWVQVMQALIGEWLLVGDRPLHVHQTDLPTMERALVTTSEVNTEQRPQWNGASNH